MKYKAKEWYFFLFWTILHCCGYFEYSFTDVLSKVCYASTLTWFWELFLHASGIFSIPPKAAHFIALYVVSEDHYYPEALAQLPPLNNVFHWYVQNAA